MNYRLPIEITLCYLRRGIYILLAVKRRGIGEGKFKGYGGGRIEYGETPEEAAVRDIKQESGVSAETENLEKVALIDFHNIDPEGIISICRVHVYFLTTWKGTPVETIEMTTPRWFGGFESLPFGMMTLADKELLREIFLKGNKVEGVIKCRPEQKTLTLDECKFIKVVHF